MSKKTDDEVQKDLVRIYGNILTLVEGSYTSRHNNMKVKCSICGKETEDKGFNFFTNHRGCSFCNKPLGEQLILSSIPDIETQVDVPIETKNKYFKI